MTTTFSILSIAAILLIHAKLHPQERITLDTEQACSYYGESAESEIYGFESSDNAIRVIDRILAVVGIERNFTIMAANVPNAMAIIQGGTRYILYSQNFILQIRNATGTDWSGISIMAHEVGHHLNGHTLKCGGSRPDIELEADKFSGFICAKLGATLAQAQAAMNSASVQGSSTHPPRSARLEAISIGWDKARSSGGETPQQPTGSSPPEEQRDLQASITIRYLGDSYGCNLPISITIG